MVRCRSCTVLAILLLSAPRAAVPDEPPAGDVVTNSLGMALVPVPAGRFFMGSAAEDAGAEEDERPRHEVTISRPFLMGRFEVTQAEYAQVMGENPSWFGPDGPGRDDVPAAEAGRHPVDRVTWDEAAEFCRRLSALPEERRAGRVYRLPTEAEWEYACRAGTTSAFHTGDALRPDDACFRPAAADDAPHATRPVGSYAANGFGLHDMHGNVWEWCADHYRFDSYGDGAVADPEGPLEGTGRVIRGGAWNFGRDYCRSANRDLTRQTRRDIGNGFRVVCEPVAP